MSLGHLVLDVLTADYKMFGFRVLKILNHLSTSVGDLDIKGSLSFDLLQLGIDKLYVPRKIIDYRHEYTNVALEELVAILLSSQFKLEWN